LVLMMNPRQYQPWRLERPQDNQDIHCKDERTDPTDGRPYRRPGSGSRDIAKAGYESVDIYNSGEGMNPSPYRSKF
jgi:hypothetical protein